MFRGHSDAIVRVSNQNSVVLDIHVVHQNLHKAKTEWVKPNYTSNTCTLALTES